MSAVCTACPSLGASAHARVVSRLQTFTAAVVRSNVIAEAHTRAGLQRIRWAEIKPRVPEKHQRATALLLKSSFVWRQRSLYVPLPARWPASSWPVRR